MQKLHGTSKWSRVKDLLYRDANNFYYLSTSRGAFAHLRCTFDWTPKFWLGHEIAFVSTSRAMIFGLGWWGVGGIRPWILRHWRYNRMHLLGRLHYIRQYNKVVCTHLWKGGEFKISTTGNVLMSGNDYHHSQTSWFCFALEISAEVWICF